MGGGKEEGGRGKGSVPQFLKLLSPLLERRGKKKKKKIQYRSEKWKRKGRKRRRKEESLHASFLLPPNGKEKEVREGKGKRER